jgi:hypothetical protein
MPMPTSRNILNISRRSGPREAGYFKHMFSSLLGSNTDHQWFLVPESHSHQSQSSKGGWMPGINFVTLPTSWFGAISLTAHPTSEGRPRPSWSFETSASVLA